MLRPLPMLRLPILAMLLTFGAVGARADDLTGLVDRYVAWRGGAAFEQLQSVHLRGSLEAAGLHGTEELWAGRDGRQRVDVDLGVVKQTQVVMAGQSWEINPSGQVGVLAQSDLQSLSRDQALGFADVLRGRAGAKAVLADSATRDGRTWSVVRVTFGDADVYDVLIDPGTGALGFYRITEDRRQRFEAFDDWRMVDGVRMPFLQTTRTEVPGGDQTVKVTSLELNGAISADRLARPAAVRKAVFADGASSTGWIDFEFYGGNRIFFPLKLNGRDVVAVLDSGATVSALDKSFAAALGLQSKGNLTAPGTGGIDTTGFTGGVKIEIGNLTLRDVNTAVFDFAPIAKRIGHPLPFILGDEIFNELAVDIDFANHRVAFRDPANLAKPPGAAEVALNRVFGNRSVAVSVEGAPPVQFEFDLGNGSPLDVYPAYYQKHDLTGGRRTSETFGGAVGGFHGETAVSLGHVAFAGVDFQQVPTHLTRDTLSGANSNVVVGNIGLPILARFRLIIDYAHDRLYAVPYADAASTPFAKDRVGLSLIGQGDGIGVEFVSPGSPAEAAGFKSGDTIARIDGKPAGDWPDAALAVLRFAASGATLTFTMADGAIRQLKAAEFF